MTQTADNPLPPVGPLRRLIAEAIGTAVLIGFGCGAMMVAASTGALGHPSVAAAWGGIVAVLIYAIGDVSGAHLNPAVTIGFAVVRRFAWREVPGYVAAQCLGALAGAAGLRLTLGDCGVAIGSTLPTVATGATFVIEAAMTAVLMFVVLGVSTGAKEKSITAGLAVGAVIGLEALVGGPLTKASMNPARSFGPAVVAWIGGETSPVIWLPIYLAAPVLGAAVGVAMFRAVTPPTARSRS